MGPTADAGQLRFGRDVVPIRRSATRTASVRRIALIGNALPRLCGLATFTTHVHDALRARFPGVTVDHYAMIDSGGDYDFPPTVAGTIEQQDVASYRAAAAAISASGADLVWVQHEFGIYGGPAGILLLDLLERVRAPVAVTLHTVLETPNDEQRQVMDRLAARASVLIVMAERAAELLQRVYRVPGSKIAMIEHGVPTRDYLAPSAARHCFGVEDRKTILTFGLLSPDKGIETMIRAMPAILDRCPEAQYRIVGATHPHLIAREGERHRESLQSLARSLGVERHLLWENRFLDESELLDRLALADVYVTPYRNPQQITSGTLSYAAALGKPIISTPYVHATELLAGGRGLLVGFDDTGGLAQAVGGLLVDDVGRERLAARIHAHSRALAWPHLAERSMRRFNAVLRDADADADAEGRSAFDWDAQGSRQLAAG